MLLCVVVLDNKKKLKNSIHFFLSMITFLYTCVTCSKTLISFLSHHNQIKEQSTNRSPDKFSEKADQFTNAKMSDTGGLSNGWTNNLNATLTNNRLLDPSNQLNHLNNLSNNELIPNNLANLNQLNNPSLYSSTADSNDSNDEDSRDSLRGSNSEINLNGDGKDLFLSLGTRLCVACRQCSWF